MEAAISAPPYSAIETMTYAETLPSPTFSAPWLPEPNTKNIAVGKISAKMIVRRLRSIRRSSIGEHGQC